jgi:uncharacterized protein (TIGR03792 family)
VVIEYLTVDVPLEWHDRYLAADHEIWTAFLQTCPGYVEKQVWRSPMHPEQFVQIIQWQTRAFWKAIDPKELARTEQAFETALGRSFPLLKSEEFVVVMSDAGP